MAFVILVGIATMLVAGTVHVERYKKGLAMMRARGVDTHDLSVDISNSGSQGCTKEIDHIFANAKEVQLTEHERKVFEASLRVRNWQAFGVFLTFIGMFGVIFSTL